MDMPTCYVLIGPQGCGKSTWCQNNLESLNDPVVISTDAYFDEIAERDGISYAEAWGMHSYDDMVKRARIALIRATMAERDIVIDQTNCTVVSRQLFRHNVPASYKMVGVVFEFAPSEICKRVYERGKATGKIIPMGAVIEKMQSFEHPLPKEFDEIVVVPQ